MRIPPALEPLVDQGVIDAVVRPLMSGKEAQVFLVETRGELRVAKVYKEQQHRSFRQRADYTEGRRTRNSRDQRAMERGSKYGKEQVEEAWRSAEVDAIYKLKAAGVAVPTPFDFVENVLVMEMWPMSRVNPPRASSILRLLPMKPRNSSSFSSARS